MEIVKRIKKIVALFAFVVLLNGSLCIPVKAAEGFAVTEAAQGVRLSDEELLGIADAPKAPEISAEAAVLIDAESGMVLYAKNADSKRFPASITKILTALVTIENSQLEEPLVFQGEALLPLPDGYVSIDPSEGEVMTVEDTLYALLLESANDAGNALAVHDSGTISEFAKKMNARAAKAGARNTHFANPSGLSDENHYTTAFDMAMILRDCMEYETFETIAGALTYTIPATNKHEERTVSMRHEMLKSWTENYYDACIAGKTGFTTPSGYTLVTCAEKDGVRLLCCVLQCEKGGQYASTRALFDYGFDSFAWRKGKELANTRIAFSEQALSKLQGSPKFMLTFSRDSEVIFPANLSVKDLETEVTYLESPDDEGNIARIAFMLGGKTVGMGRLGIHFAEAESSDRISRWSEQVHAAEDALIQLKLCLAGIAAVVLIFAAAVVTAVRKNRKEDAIDTMEQPECEIMEAVREDKSTVCFVDFEKAKEAFESYLDGYDRTDEKISLKIVHTYGVVECSRQIAKRMNLTKEDTELAALIALLHDIGRFEQVKQFDSFEPATMDHAQAGVEILFDQGLIRRFLEDPSYDAIIYTAIARHSDYALEEIEDAQTLLQARLIRDADKLDNCRVKLEDSIEILLGMCAEEVGSQEISDGVYETACAGNAILSADRRTKMDYWVSYLAYFYDINYKETMQIILEQDYLEKLAARIPYRNPDTAKKMKKITKDIRIYMENRCKEEVQA